MGRFGSMACLASSARTTFGCPTSKTRTPNSRAACTLPSTSGRGAWSPPMASTAMVIMGFCPQDQRNAKSLSRRLYRFALIVAAMRTRLVRLLHLMAIRTFAQLRLGQKIVRPPRAGPSFGMPPFWVRHKLHLVPAALGGLYRAFGPEKLLFFQQVLFDTRERGQAGIRSMGLAAALFVIQVGAAIRAQPPAIALANGLDGKRQQYLLFQHVRQKKAISFVKADIRIVIFQPVFPMFGQMGILGKRRVKQVKRTAHFLGDRFQAARADQFHLGFEVALDADLAFQQLRRGVHFQRLNLLDFCRMEVNAARRIRLVDAELADS